MQYNIRPTKDATIYEEKVDLNSGEDAILEISNSSFNDDIPYYNSRILMYFDLSTLQSFIIDNSISNPKFNLKLYASDLQELPMNYNVNVMPVSGSWINGIGKKYNDPYSTDGVSWKYKSGITQDDQWAVVSSSFSTSSYKYNPGGGNWYTSYICSQSFNGEVNDILIDVSDIVNSWISGTIENDGFIIKGDSVYESITEQKSVITYFSKNTNTIFEPRIEMLWDVSTIISGSSSYYEYEIVKTNYTEDINDVPQIYFTESFCNTINETYTVNSSSIDTIIISSSVIENKDVEYQGTSSLGALSVYDSIGNIESQFEGYLNGYINGIISDDTYLTGKYTSGTTNVKYEEYYVIGSLELNGNYSGYIKGQITGSISQSMVSGTWTGSIDLSSYNGIYATQSYTVNTIVPVSKYQITSSQYYSVTQSNNLLLIPDLNTIEVDIENLKMEYYSDDIVEFRLHVRDSFPKKTYNPKSEYIEVKYYLPTSSYYGIKDVASDTMIIEYNELNKLSCDFNGDYFKFYMQNLIPERIYEIIFKIQLEQSTKYYGNYIFKLCQ